ncbi:MAG: hypothetical protein EPO24_03795 [Bacteroidetes bacterium]|nr:MAG: hypothetical protein EPO24_03795 [Bacteroidota bacterium]
MSLLLVMGIALTLGIVGFTINSSKMRVTERVAGFQKYSVARNIAHSAVNMTLRAFDRNDTTLIYPLEAGKTVTITRQMMDGQSVVTAKLPPSMKRDTIDFTTVGTAQDSSYWMKLRLQRSPKPFPAVNACVGFASPGIVYNTDGKPHRITGEDYKMNGTRGNPAKDTIGVATKTAADSAAVAPDAANITGDPYKIKVAPPDDPSAYINEYIAMADYVFPNGSSNNGTYGSAAMPVIGYAKGEVKFGGNGKFYGVLVINGSIDFTGTFDIYGLVLCYGSDIQISVSTSSGNPSLYGGLIMSGAPGSKFSLKGTPQLLYSTEALEMAKYIGKMQAYKVIYWYYQ